MPRLQGELEVDALRGEMSGQIQRLREDVSAQFNWMINRMGVMVLAFAGVVASTIWFAL